MTDWHRQTAAAAAAACGVDLARGLDEAAVAAGLAKHGRNELVDRGGKSPWLILWQQFTATMVLILVVAAVTSAFLGKWLEAGSIAAIIVLFGVLGFAQEYRAERAMAALRRMAVPSVRVLRAGDVTEVPAGELVPGDVVLLEAGNLVPADLRLVESANLRIQEAALTGESEPVEKIIDPLVPEELPLGDRLNLAYLGTQVAYGRGRGLVVATGMATELGRIAGLLQGAAEEPTPLQQRLDRVGQALAIAGVAVAALIMGIGILRAEPVRDMFLTAVSVAVAVVPEGLPAVVTVTLALGAQRMLARQALIRRLPAVETLGSVTVICSDKTGTLTENRMTVTVLDVAGHRLELLEEYRRHALAVSAAERRPELLSGSPTSLGLLLAGGALCNDAVLRPDPEAGRYHAIGDPTEGALIVAAAQVGLDKAALDEAWPRLGEVPFDSERKRMSTLHARAGDAGAVAALDAAVGEAPVALFTKGAVDGLVGLAAGVWHDDHVEPLTAAWRERLIGAAEDLAAGGMRVLGVAWRPLEAVPAALDETVESDLVLIGLLGLMDPPRPEVERAVQTCRDAGIRPVMITGDHPLTALAIARDLGLDVAAGALTGLDVERLSDAELADQVAVVSVYARVSPEHKLRIVRALQQRGEVAAMTGDGVNDAPSLKQSDIGVAMGITGTDVAKEAADMVLLDDNFTTIVAAVEEGRVIYDNVRRFVKFSIAGNLGKVMVMLLAPLFGINVALLPLQLLWLNLVTDGLLGLGMGVEPAERNVMQRPPVSPRAGIFSDGGALHVTWVGLVTGAVALGVGAWYHAHDHGAWQTMVFCLLTLLQCGQALAVRSATDSVFRIGLFGNRLLLGLVLVVVGLSVAAVYAPVLQTFLKTEPLRGGELAMCFAWGAVVFVAIEVEKAIRRR